MNKAEELARIAYANNLSKQKALKFVETVVEVMENVASRGERMQEFRISDDCDKYHVMTKLEQKGFIIKTPSLGVISVELPPYNGEDDEEITIKIPKEWPQSVPRTMPDPFIHRGPKIGEGPSERF